MSYLPIFLTGLSTGGLTCLAVQGGLLLGVLAGSSRKSIALFAFLTGKLLSHSLLGAFLGALGQTLLIDAIIRGYIQIALGLYLFLIALHHLDIHPFFRRFVISPPKKFLKLTRNSLLSPNSLTPFILGFLTILIPCASTQSVELLALSTNHPFEGLLTMLIFTLGTFPTFLIFGLLLNQMSHSLKKAFSVLAGLLLIFLSLSTINSGLTLTGSIYTFQNFYLVATNNQPDSVLPLLQNNRQYQTINVSNTGYHPTHLTLKKGIPAEISLITSNVSSCATSFTIPSQNISKLLPQTGKTIITFTPQKSGPIVFSCSMGMYSGIINVY